MLVIRRVELSATPVDLLGQEVDVTRPYFLRVNVSNRGGVSSDVRGFVGGSEASLDGVDDIGVDCNVVAASEFSTGRHVSGARFFAVGDGVGPGDVPVALVFAYGE